MEKVILTFFLLVPFWIVQLANAGSAVFDVETTQHCINAGTCHEANPLMPSDPSKAYAVNFGLTGAEGLASWWLHKNHDKKWWLPPVIGGSIHIAAGITNGIRFGW